MQFNELVSAANVPAAQGVHAGAPLAENVPTGQFEQTVFPVPAANRPPGQDAHPVDPAMADAVPDGQGVQVVAPETDENVPATQGVQGELPVLLKVPGAQADCARAR